ncbi:MAG: hypothetical protein HC799_04540 [Limnothrix sp. RL_2_0]|nr:hypothetical protein [Limnothrix sp. RL_2_0]
MPGVNQGDGGDRPSELDLLRDVLGGSVGQGDEAQTEAKIAELESQMNQMREEMRAQGDKVQDTLHQKIDEVLKALQVNQFESAQASPTSVQRSPQSNPAPPILSPQIQSPAASELRRSPQPPPVSTPAIPVPAPLKQQHPYTPVPTPPAPAPIHAPPVPTETNPRLNSMGDLDAFTEQLNAILQPNNTPQNPPSPPPVLTPTPPSPVAMTGRSPHPDLDHPPLTNPSATTNNPPVTNPSVVNSPAVAASVTNPTSVPKPLPQSTFEPESPSPSLTVIAEDQATRINQLKQVLRDEDVVQLRQTNEKLDFKLRQVEDYIASSQQPINDLLPLMTELVQLKIKEAKTLEPAPPTSPPRKGTPWGAIFAFLLLLILIPLGLYGYWLRREHLLEQDMAIALTATPELAIYRLGADVQGNKLYLTGKVPNETLRDRASRSPPVPYPVSN